MSDKRLADAPSDYEEYRHWIASNDPSFVPDSFEDWLARREECTSLPPRRHFEPWDLPDDL